METIEILGENRFEAWTRSREACRAIVIKDGRILMSYEAGTDQWFIPGGGVEDGEMLSDCCRRETEEETGCIVAPGEHFLTINEFYEEWKFISYYFVCELLSENGVVCLTEREKRDGLIKRWIDFDEAVEIFSKHDEYKADEMKRGAYLREYTALLSFIKQSGK